MNEETQLRSLGCSLERHDWNMIALKENYNLINSINISEERMFPQKEGGVLRVQQCLSNCAKGREGVMSDSR